MVETTAGRRERLALHLVQLGLVLIVLIALPYKSFDLDRFFVPKELVLHATAVIAALLCLGGKRRLELSFADLCIAGFLILSIVSAVLAQNWWLAGRALAITISGALLFWVGVTLRAAGLQRQVLSAAAVAIVVGAITALVQAYIGPATDLFSLNRAPGGTFGNRNFMAHLAAIGVPVVVIAALSARTRVGFFFGAIGSVILAAALFLSRSRAAWLAVLATGIVVVGVALLARASISGGRTWGRLRVLAAAAIIGTVASAFLPNQLEWKSNSPYLDTMRGLVNTSEGSGAGRVIQYKNSLEMAMSRPIFGVGPGNWSVHYIKFAERRDPSLSSAGGMTDNPWPSSDWVAFVSERGLVATALLVLAFIAIVLRAMRELPAARETGDFERARAALTLIGTVVATAVVGLFDAVLLIAIPSMFLWLIAGVLSPPRAASRSIGSGVREFGAPLLVLFGLAAIIRSAGQIEGMAIYHGATRLTTIASAAKYDPGSYRIRMRLAEGYANRGDCGRAVPHARAANGMFPNAADPRAVLRRCGVRVGR
jgi:O-antigen ligase